MFKLIEEEALLHNQISKQTTRSRLILARIRLQQGRQRTSAEAQLPRWRPYKALCRLFMESTPCGAVMKLLRHSVDPSLGFLQPLTNIFGNIVPVSLQVAKRNWEHCVDLIVECANVQMEIQSTTISIRKLRRSLQRR
ncbi:hypothetical protein KR009_001224 [Drosophila setifemur]|nr:hypothetical protein KR009_001224 [Drosophila setifemur]